MKAFIKQKVRELADFADYLDWINGGRHRNPPHYYKRMVVREYAEKYHCGVFVETGTYLGDMAWSMRDVFDYIFTIELDPVLYAEAEIRFSKTDNVRVLKGDSGRILQLLNFYQPTLYWLDAHYSGGVTARGEHTTPIVKELDTIRRQGRDNRVILIDDARLFGKSDWPSIGWIAKICEQMGYAIDVKHDIIRLTPGGTK